MYKNQGFKVNTKPISVRLRRDLIEWMEIEGINKNAFINDCVMQRMYFHQRNGRPSLDLWTRKNR